MVTLDPGVVVGWAVAASAMPPRATATPNLPRFFMSLSLVVCKTTLLW